MKKEFTFSEIIDFGFVLGKLSNTKGFSIEEMIKLLQLKKVVREKTENYQEIFAEIMTQYKVEIIKSTEGQDVYSWAGHAQAEEISQKVLELSTTKNTIEDLNFLSTPHFFQIVEGMDLNSVEFLSGFLKEE